MPDQPPKKPTDEYEVIDGPDAGYEVVDPPPAQPRSPVPPAGRLAVARPVRRPVPAPAAGDEADDDFDHRPQRPPAPPHWFFRYVVNLRGAVALGVLVTLLTAARVAVWLSAPPARTPPPAPAAATGGGPKAADLGPPPAGPPPLPAGWAEYTDHLGEYVARVPAAAPPAAVPLKGSPTLKSDPRGVRWAGGAATYHVVAINDGWGHPGPTGDAADWWADNQAESHLRWFDSYTQWRPGYDLFAKSRPVWLAGRRAAAVSRVRDDKQTVLHLRGVRNGADGYYLAVVVPKGTPDTAPEVAAFFDGFRLTPGAAPPAGAAAPPMAAPPAPAATPAPTRPAPSPVERPADLGPAPAPPPLPAGWAEFPDPQGAFTARLPAGPPPAPQAVKEWGATTVKPRGWAWERDGRTFHLIVVEEWPKARPGAPAKTDAQADRANRAHLGWLPSYVDWAAPYRQAGPGRPVWLAGRRAAADTRPAADGKTVLHLRGLVADGAGYYLAVAGPAGLADTASEVAGFFDGFQVAAEAGPKKAGRAK